jgi:N-methylhydantoinase B
MSATTHIDPITYEVIAHRLWSINEEGATTIVHASGSPVVHATDYNFGIYTRDGELAVSGVFYMIPIFVMQLVIKEILERWSEDINPGDVFVTNDPFVAGIHQSDVQFVSPFFHDGELVAWTGCMAHLIDVGGMYPGSWCPGATDLYQEGLMIPPARIVSGGAVNHGLWNTILSNSRVAPQVANDMSAFLSAHRVSQERLRIACEQYGAAAVGGTMDAMIDRSERGMRSWLGELPDGDFEHVILLDHDGIRNEIYKIDCLMRKRGGELEFDFAGSSDVIVGIGNATRAGTFGSVGAAVLGVFGGDLAWNGGLMRPITVSYPENSMVSAERPAPISAGSTGATYLIECAGVTCLGKLFAFSEHYQDYVSGPTDGSWLLSQWGGENQFGESFATMVMDPLGWGGPAFRFRDGVDVGGSMFVPGGGFNDVELNESTQPLLYLWRRENADSGGAGMSRGGNGIEVAMALYDTQVASTFTGASMGVVVPSTIGVFGAYPGATGSYEHIAGADWRARLARGELVSATAELEGEHTFPEAKCSFRVGPEDVVNHITQTAGGYGDPLEREPLRVLADVRDGHVSAGNAVALYGVVLVGAGTDIDSDATRERRETIRRLRMGGLSNLRDRYEVADLPAVACWGDILRLVVVDDALWVQAAGSGALLGPLGDDWRASAPWREVPAAEAGPGITIDERVQIRQYVDPISGRSLWVDVMLRGDRPPVDFRFTSATWQRLRDAVHGIDEDLVR